jgi:hypothetical protein
MLLHSFKMPVLSLTQLDRITRHNSKKYTWMSDALLWLYRQGFEVKNYENLDYEKFADEGEEYLKRIWDKETFFTQRRYSDLRKERLAARIMLKTGIKIINTRLSLRNIRDKFIGGYFVMLSVNPYTLKGMDGYGSHMIVVGGFKGRHVKLYDPDINKPYQVTYRRLENAISEGNKSDFNAIFVKKSVE